MIGDGKVAPRHVGSEHRTSPTDRECPICFLQYPAVNVLKCCSAHICTECYLQVRPQKAKSYPCPFCNHPKMTVTPAMAMNAESMLLREEAEQRVIEAKIRQRAALLREAEQQNAEAAAATAAAASWSTTEATDDTNRTEFGSSLQQHERISRRSSSLPSDQDRPNNDNYHNTNATSTTNSSPLQGMTVDVDVDVDVDINNILRDSFAMTPEERRLLEDEMRAQHSHPLTRRLEAEAEERRIINEQEYLLRTSTSINNAGRSSAHNINNNISNTNPFFYIPPSSRSRRSLRRTSHNNSSICRGGERHHYQPQTPRRDWNQIVEAFERGGHGEVNSLDDLVVLEAAMILSMEEENRRRASGLGENHQNHDGDIEDEDHRHQQQHTSTAATDTHGHTDTGAARLPAEYTSYNNNNSNSTYDGSIFDASQHANDGFPLVRSRLAGRHPEIFGISSASTSTAMSRSDDQNILTTGVVRDRGYHQLLRATEQPWASEGNHRRRRHNSSSNSAAALDTVALAMRGITEDDQLAMAIAASLQDQQQQQQQQQQQDQDQGRTIASSYAEAERHSHSSRDEESSHDGAASSNNSNSNNEGSIEETNGTNVKVEESHSDAQLTGSIGAPEPPEEDTVQDPGLETRSYPRTSIPMRETEASSLAAPAVSDVSVGVDERSEEDQG